MNHYRNIAIWHSQNLGVGRWVANLFWVILECLSGCSAVLSPRVCLKNWTSSGNPPGFNAMYDTSKTVGVPLISWYRAMRVKERKRVYSLNKVDDRQIACTWTHCQVPLQYHVPWQIASSKSSHHPVGWLFNCLEPQNLWPQASQNVKLTLESTKSMKGQFWPFDRGDAARFWGTLKQCPTRAAGMLAIGHIFFCDHNSLDDIPQSIEIIFIPFNHRILFFLLTHWFFHEWKELSHFHVESYPLITLRSRANDHINIRIVKKVGLNGWYLHPCPWLTCKQFAGSRWGRFADTFTFGRRDALCIAVGSGWRWVGGRRGLFAMNLTNYLARYEHECETKYDDPW